MVKAVLEIPDGEIEWKEAKTMKGKLFSSGQSGKLDGTTADAITNTIDKTPFGIAVSFTVSNRWVDTSPDVAATTGIFQYNLQNWSGGFDWRLNIMTNVGYNYTFFDADGDGYNLNVFDTSTAHFVRYNSDNPNIVFCVGG